MKIARVETIHLAVPAVRSRVSLTEPAPPPAHWLAVRLHTDDGAVGLGFTTTTTGAAAVRSLIENDLGPLAIGEDPTDTERHFSRAQARFRAAGWAGLAARAYAAIDIALWDLRAKAAALPLYRLLGGSRTAVPCFAGDLAAVGVDAHRTVQAAGPLVEQGVRGVVVEVGGGDVQQDADRVQQVRDGLGESAWLGIAADGRYDLATALAMAHFYEEDVGIDWLEAPLPGSDRVGYQRLAERMEVPLAAGAAFDDRDAFRRALEAGAVRVFRPDPLRLGGITPVLKVVALAEAFHVSVVPYRLPELGGHLACGLPNIPMVEWGSWGAALFARPAAPRDGKLVPPDGPGLGLELNADAVARFGIG